MDSKDQNFHRFESREDQKLDFENNNVETNNQDNEDFIRISNDGDENERNIDNFNEYGDNALEIVSSNNFKADIDEDKRTQETDIPNYEENNKDICCSNPSKPKKKKSFECEEGEDSNVIFPHNSVHLNINNSDLHFVMVEETVGSKNIVACKNLIKNEMHNLWCSTRATHGASRGKLFFECKILKKLDIPLKSDDSKFFIRVGWSSIKHGYRLGDGPSCGFENTGKLFVNGKSTSQGTRYSVGDTIGAYIDLDSNPVSLKFTVNGEDAGVSASIPIENSPMFPCVYFKNFVFQANFVHEERSFEPLATYSFIGSVDKDSLVENIFCINSPEETEVIMMVGLASSGKSTWVRNFVKENPQKNFYVIGRSLIYDRIKSCDSDSSKRLIFSEKTISKITGKFLQLASKRNRNYIIDQTNCHENTRKKRMQLFLKSGRRLAVFVGPRLSLLHQRLVSSKDTNVDYEKISEEDLNDLKMNITLPTESEGFNDLFYVDCDEITAPGIIDDYKYDAKRYKLLKRSPKSSSTSSGIRKKKKVKEIKRDSPHGEKRRRSSRTRSPAPPQPVHKYNEKRHGHERIIKAPLLGSPPRQSFNNKPIERGNRRMDRSPDRKRSDLNYRSSREYLNTNNYKSIPPLFSHGPPEQMDHKASMPVTPYDPFRSGPNIEPLIHQSHGSSNPYSYKDSGHYKSYQSGYVSPYTNDDSSSRYSRVISSSSMPYSLSNNTNSVQNNSGSRRPVQNSLIPLNSNIPPSAYNQINNSTNQNQLNSSEYYGRSSSMNISQRQGQQAMYQVPSSHQSNNPPYNTRNY